MKSVFVDIGELCVSESFDIEVALGPVAGGLAVLVYRDSAPKIWGVFHSLLIKSSSSVADTLKKPAVFLPQAFDMLLARLKGMGAPATGFKVKACGGASLMTPFEPFPSLEATAVLEDMAQKGACTLERVWIAPSLIRKVRIDTSTFVMTAQTDEGDHAL
jgi:chemotaxis receptor (MCP) glutamine deamidase CheD